MKEKRLRFGSFELALAAEAARADRIRNSIPYRYMLRPAMNLARKSGPPRPTAESPRAVDGLNNHRKGSSRVHERVSALRWYHTIDLGDVVTPGLVDARSIAGQGVLPARLDGKRVLDVGTCDGFWAFEMERRGASEVVAIDLDTFADYDVPRRKREDVIGRGEEMLASLGLQPVGESFRLAKEILGSNVQREVVSVYDLSPEVLGTFDVVLCGYLLVHLRDPQTALENIFSVTRDFAIVIEPINVDLESFNRPLSSFVGTDFMGMWWEHNSKAWRVIMQTAGFDPVEELLRADLDNRLDMVLKTVALKGCVGSGSPDPDVKGTH
jgi:tRNA (mo5U34)-methyltransferase